VVRLEFPVSVDTVAFQVSVDILERVELQEYLDSLATAEFLAPQAPVDLAATLERVVRLEFPDSVVTLVHQVFPASVAIQALLEYPASVVTLVHQVFPASVVTLVHQVSLASVAIQALLESPASAATVVSLELAASAAIQARPEFLASVGTVE
jgi:hypothetical protein